WADDQHDIFSNEIDMMGKILSPTTLIEAGDGAGERHLRRLAPTDDGSAIEGRPNRKVDGAEMVAVRELMDKLAGMDAERGTPKWGGLTRRQTPEGDILWLDQGHLKIYLSKRKMP
ncbi:MAG: hypothetical protein ACPG8W_26195, partial [Candidatus Promineifilaceae bacterium]